MAKAKKRNFIPLYEDYFDQIDFLSTEEAGKLFTLISAYSALDEANFQAYENSIPLETGVKILWSFIKSDIQSYLEKKKLKSKKNAANARKRWGTEQSSSDSDITGQKNIIFTAEPSADNSEPVLTAHATGMRMDANGMRKDAIASPIYNNNIIHNHTHNISESEKNAFSSDQLLHPSLEEVCKLFVENGSTEEAAQKYFDYYENCNWYCAKSGKAMSNLETSVVSWIERNIRYQSKKADAKKQRIADFAAQIAADQQLTDAQTASETPKHSHAPAYRKRARKPGFLDFEQRNYDYDALMEQLRAI